MAGRPNRSAPERSSLPMLATGTGEGFVSSTSQFAELERPLLPLSVVEPRAVERGVIAFDLDGTILDSIGLISTVAAKLLHEAFGTPEDEGRVHYLATTGMPFEAQLAQLYPGVKPEDRHRVSQLFHTRKVKEAYSRAHPFPEVSKLLKRLGEQRWTLVISTGAEREMADLILEREGLRYWFEEVLGSGQGTKREHLVEYRRRYPGAPMILVGDSRFDMEAASSSEGVIAVGRASRLPGWTLTPDDLRRWGARWADYSLAGLPDSLDTILRDAAGGRPGPKRRPAGPRRRNRKGRDRESQEAGGDPASV